MEILYSRMDQLFEQLIESLPEIIFALAIFLLFHFLARSSKKVYLNILERTPLTVSNMQFFGKLIYTVVFLIGILIGLNILGFYGIVASIVASGGVTAIILGFAFKDIGENFLAGFFLAFSRPFTNGDLIEIEGIIGRVRTIELRHTHIKKSDGCDVFVPSSQLMSKPLYNYTRDGMRRGSFTIGIDYRDNADKACQIILEGLKSDNMVIAKPAPMVQITGFSPNHVEVTAYFWIYVNVDKQEYFLADIKSGLMDRTRCILIEHGFTFSSEVSTALDVNDMNVNVKKLNEKIDK